MTSTEQTPDDLLLRPAAPDDAPAVAEVVLRARAHAPMPPGVHTEDEVRDWIAGRVLAGDVWVAEAAGTVVAMMELSGAWLDQLYVVPEYAGRGVGSALVDVAKSLRPGGFGLWVFVENEPARSFYAHRGLVELESTDGTGNEEGAPDLRMVWPGEDPVTCLRGQIDEIDTELALLLARRIALTRAVQRFKPVPGHAGRDLARESEIAQRMASRAPGLGAEHFRRIMHEVIGVGLDLAEQDRG